MHIRRQSEGLAFILTALLVAILLVEHCAARPDSLVGSVMTPGSGITRTLPIAGQPGYWEAAGQVPR